MIKPIELTKLAASPTHQVVLEINEAVPDLNCLTPVQGEVIVHHQGDFVEVAGCVHTIVTLQCHRCLQSFNYRLETNFDEVLWLVDSTEDKVPQEREVVLTALDEHIPHDSQLDVLDLLYQLLCLELPSQNLCSVDCPGVSPPPEIQALSDQRWSALAQLKQELS
ncbi:MAG: DUF177 domain-containing protein [Gemmatimonadaceae bacterium]|nr:DUF177 domain-containing protein [Gloeobacterales cyanobacterium ES-bin-141]